MKEKEERTKYKRRERESMSVREREKERETLIKFFYILEYLVNYDFLYLMYFPKYFSDFPKNASD